MKDVLVVDDDAEMLVSLARVVSPLIAPLSLHGVGSVAGALAALNEHMPKVVVLDLCIDEKVGVESGFSVLREVVSRDSSVRVIVLTGHGSLTNGVKALNLGAANFVEKPADPHHLAALVRDAATQVDIRRHYREMLARDESSRMRQLCGSSTAMVALREQIAFLATTTQPVLIVGETGTGKGVCARLIHELSPRRTKNFIHYLPNFGGGDIVQSELFGHVKGSFTGAVDNRRGLALEANGGSLFIDELDEVPAETQVRLLDLIQERRVRPVGSDSYVATDCRFIAATNARLNEALDAGKLRRDLHHRLAHSLVTLPPLRERREDIPELVRSILRELQDREAVNVFDLDDRAVQELQDRGWPGNVRELQAVVQNSAYLAQYRGRSSISVHDIERPAEESGGGGSVAPTAADSVRTGQRIPLKDQVRDFQQRLIREALERHGGNRSHAAEELGIYRGTLVRMLEE